MFNKTHKMYAIFLLKRIARITNHDIFSSSKQLYPSRSSGGNTVKTITAEIADKKAVRLLPSLQQLPQEHQAAVDTNELLSKILIYIQVETKLFIFSFCLRCLL